MAKELTIGDASYDVPPAEKIELATVGRPKTVGVSGMGLCEFMFTLFQTNEKRKLTDGQLRAVLQQEYAEIEKTLARMKKPGVVSTHRSKYNTGYYGKIKVYSLRYDEQGSVLKRGCRSTMDKQAVFDFLTEKCPQDARLQPPPKVRKKRRRKVTK